MKGIVCLALTSFSLETHLLKEVDDGVALQLLAAKPSVGVDVEAPTTAVDVIWNKKSILS